VWCGTDGKSGLEGQGLPTITWPKANDPKMMLMHFYPEEIDSKSITINIK